ncbi:MAG: nucleotidyltransferase domain-containing protein [Thermoanaerobaculia bacterium]
MKTRQDAHSRPIAGRVAELQRLCARFGVRRLEAFGSAVGGGFDAATSDVDFLVELEPPAGVGYADAYFGFKESLEALFERPVDLVSLSALRNPYFLAGIAPSRHLIYAA